jgi:cytoskeletal protein RodZ
VHNSQVRGERFLLIVAILANVVLVIVFVFLFGLIVNQPSEPDAAATADDLSATEEPTSTETAVRGELSTIVIPSTLTPPPTLTLAPTSTPEPTRREILEPTKPPYVFPTPIYIPPTPRERFTPTRGR